MKRHVAQLMCGSLKPRFPQCCKTTSVNFRARKPVRLLDEFQRKVRLNAARFCDRRTGFVHSSEGHGVGRDGFVRKPISRHFSHCPSGRFETLLVSSHQPVGLCDVVLDPRNLGSLWIKTSGLLVRRERRSHVTGVFLRVNV